MCEKVCDYMETEEQTTVVALICCLFAKLILACLLGTLVSSPCTPSCALFKVHVLQGACKSRHSCHWGVAHRSALRVLCELCVANRTALSDDNTHDEQRPIVSLIHYKILDYW
jgi:hypothetical protein